MTREAQQSSQTSLHSMHLTVIVSYLCLRTSIQNFSEQKMPDEKLHSATRTENKKKNKTTVFNVNVDEKIMWQQRRMNFLQLKLNY